jgi:hypothetical protein
LHLLSFSASFVLMFVSYGVAQSISRQVFSFLSCSTVSDRCASIVRSVMTCRTHITVVLIFMTISSICLWHWSVTSNPICLNIIQWMKPATLLSTSVFISRKYCASCNNMFYGLFCLIARPAFTINWLLHDVPLTTMHTECLILGYYYKTLCFSL